MELVDTGMDRGWDIQAKRLLQSELAMQGITREQLVLLLKEQGINTTKASIDNKISRGSFSAAFLLQCLSAIGREAAIVAKDKERINEKR